MKSAFETQLEELVYPRVSKPSPLPLTHTTDWATFLSIANDGKLSSSKPCTVYGELLIYAFYGRPAYRFRDSEVSHHLASYSPVCFLLQADMASSAARVLPFDSGGFAKYKAAMHASLQLANFELTVGSDAPTRLVESLWGSNGDYYRSNLLGGRAVDPSAIALLHYYNLISNKLAQPFDERCSTIEMQFASPLVLNGNVMGIVVPSGVAGHKSAEVAKSLNAELIVYDFQMPYYANDFHVTVRAVVRDYFQARGLF